MGYRRKTEKTEYSVIEGIPIIDIIMQNNSFRHSMRDRLRAFECPSDIIDQIVRWSSIGEK